MSDLLAIGASGVKAYGKALSVVGDNIANAQTEGYIRRTVRLEEAPQVMRSLGFLEKWRNGTRSLYARLI